MAVTDPTRIRTTVNVDREVYEIFVGMSESGGMSVSRCIGEWLADTAEGAQFIATKMREARAAPMAVMREMQAMVVGVHESVAGEIEAIRTRAKATPPAARAPGGSPSPGRGRPRSAPSSNTGRKGPRTSRAGGRS